MIASSSKKELMLQDQPLCLEMDGMVNAEGSLLVRLQCCEGLCFSSPKVTLPPTMGLSVGCHCLSSDTGASHHWECWDNCESLTFIWCEGKKKKEISFKKKSAGGVCSCRGFASALEGTPCCLQRVISLAALSWPWGKSGRLKVKHGILSRFQRGLKKLACAGCSFPAYPAIL